MERYHVSLRVVNGTLERLEKTGAIWRERYRGIFCKKHAIRTFLPFCW